MAIVVRIRLTLASIRMMNFQMIILGLLLLASCRYLNHQCNRFSVHGLAFSTPSKKTSLLTDQLERKAFFQNAGSVLALVGVPLVVASPTHDAAIASGGATAGKYT
jgi:hypothetical protein